MEPMHSSSLREPRWAWTQDYPNWNIPNAVQVLVPGYENVASSLMKQTIANNGVATIPDLRELCLEAEVKMIA